MNRREKIAGFERPPLLKVIREIEIKKYQQYTHQLV